MYVSIFMISKPITDANNRSELKGNVQTLQKLTTYEGPSFTYFSGQSGRQATRKNMQALHLGDPTTYPAPFRWHDAPEAEGGYAYGPGKSPAMATAPLSSPADYPDTALFGYMVKSKGSGEGGTAEDSEGEESEATPAKGGKKKEKATAINIACKSVLSFSRFVSATPFTGDVAFRLGTKADGANAPFGIEEHHARYHGYLTINMTDLVRVCGGVEKAQSYLTMFLDALSEGLVVGGNHSAHASQLIPDLLLAWTHRCPASGLVFETYETEKWLSGKPLPVEDIKASVAILGVSPTYGGPAVGQSVPASWAEVKALALAEIKA